MYDETGRQLYCCRNSGGFCLFTGNSFSNTDSGHLSGIGDMLDDVYALESYKKKGIEENKAGAGFISCIGFTAPIKTLYVSQYNTERRL